MNRFFDRVGRVFLRVFEQTGLWFTMLLRTVAWGIRPPYSVNETARQMQLSLKFEF